MGARQHPRAIGAMFDMELVEDARHVALRCSPTRLTIHPKPLICSSKSSRHAGVKLDGRRLAVEAEVRSGVELKILTGEISPRAVRGHLLAGTRGVPIPLAPQLARQRQPLARRDSKVDQLH